MPGYQQVTLSQAISALATRLGDPTNAFWSQAELTSYIVEALRTWQAHSQFYSIKAQFNTQVGTVYYSLPALIPQLSFAVTDQDLISDLEYTLQEPQALTAWVGSEQYSYSGLVGAIARRRDQFILETGLPQTILTVPNPVATDGFFYLEDTTIDVRRAVWTDVSSKVPGLLWRADEFAFLAASASWFNTPGLPTDFSTVLQQPLGMQLSPPPANEGTLTLFTVESGPALVPQTQATPLGIPDDFVWVIKWGVLADLFGQAGPGQDTQRSLYCQSRWTDGVALARMTNWVKLGYQNGLPSFIDSLEELDTASPSWISTTPAPPAFLAAAGMIIAVAPVPDGVYSCSFDLTPKMLVPTVESDYLQVGQEYIDIIIDYSTHLAHAKEGAEELQQSMNCYKNLINAATVSNDMLRAFSPNFDVLSDRSQREGKERLRLNSDLNIKELNYAS